MAKRRMAKAKLDAAKGIRLDVGCGKAKNEGYVGLDQRALPGVDIVHDFLDTPWPLDDNVAMVTVMSHVYEHIPPWYSLKVMAEVHRVSKDGGVVMLSGPFGLGQRYLQDPTHCNPVGWNTFNYWDPLRAPTLYGVYDPPVMHTERFEVVPAAGDRDFEVALRVCKGECRHYLEMGQLRTKG